MLHILKNRDYAKLFGAQIVALLGSGLLTVALGLLAFDLAGARAGIVLGTAYTIKMVAYVGLSPIVQAAVQKWPRKRVLITADLIRAGVAMCLPFVTEIWQIYTLIFILQAASATFTPAYQAVLPDILPNESDYTRALSLSRLAYDLENLLSPAMAGILLVLVSYHTLFWGTVFGFLGSAVLVYLAMIPPLTATPERPFWDRATRGIRLYLATPRLRGLLALTFAAAAIGAFVLVNTVVLVRSSFGLNETGLALAMAAFGAGSMTAAFALPPLLDRVADRTVMLYAAGAMIVVGLGVGLWMMVALPDWALFLGSWAIIGGLYSAVLTPSGRLIRRSSDAADRAALFTAQFALSHACWLVTYPMAGYLGGIFGLSVALVVLSLMALVAGLIALKIWPQAQSR